MKALKTVQKVRATLIPPNSNEEDLQELRGLLEYMEQCEEANANKISLEYVSVNMNMDAKAMRDIMLAVSRGYGDFAATGINMDGHQQTVNSNQDAAYTVNIQENIGEEEYNEVSKNVILTFLDKLFKR